MPPISGETKRLIKHYQDWYKAQQPQEGISTVHVDEIASRVATFYEKLRKVVDWREEHLMRRIAIERILKRRLLVAKNGHDAESFLFELVRGGHFPNDTIPRAKIKIIQRAIDKYAYLIENFPPAPKDKMKSELYTQLMGVAACEVEEILDPSSYLRAQALVEYMCSYVKKRVSLGERAKRLHPLNEAEINTQIYIAVQQALMKSDQTTIVYNLFKARYPKWLEMSPDQHQEILEDLAKNIFKVIKSMEADINHPLANKFFKICDQYNTPYLLTGDIVAGSPIKVGERITNSEILEKLIRNVYNKRLRSLKSRTRRAAVYSTISIFLTNIFSLYLVEIPFTRFIYGQLNVVAQIADVLVPTLLMAALVVTIKPPKERNLALVVSEIKKNIYGSNKKDLYEIEVYPRKGVAYKLAIGTIYTLSFAICLGAIIGFCFLISFPPLSYFIFIVFTSLITFTGIKIRQRARELDITKAKVRFIQFFTDPFALPIIRLGRWISARWTKYNIVSVAFNLLVETPFMVFAEFVEHWRNFIKEKREDIH